MHQCRCQPGRPPLVAGTLVRHGVAPSSHVLDNQGDHMSFHAQTTLVGLARAAVDAKARMTEAVATPAAATYISALVHDHTADDEPVTATFIDAVVQMTNNVWRHGDPFVLAPAMTAIVAAAAEALDLTGDLLSRDVAPVTEACCSFPNRSTSVPAPVN
jgi:hypothetical protein